MGARSLAHRVGCLAETRGHGRQRRENIKNTKEGRRQHPALCPRGPWGASTVCTSWLPTGFLFCIKNTWF